MPSTQLLKFRRKMETYIHEAKAFQISEVFFLFSINNFSRKNKVKKMYNIWTQNLKPVSAKQISRSIFPICLCAISSRGVLNAWLGVVCQFVQGIRDFIQSIRYFASLVMSKRIFKSIDIYYSTGLNTLNIQKTIHRNLDKNYIPRTQSKMSVTQWCVSGQGINRENILGFSLVRILLSICHWLRIDNLYTKVP